MPRLSRVLLLHRRGGRENGACAPVLGGALRQDKLHRLQKPLIHLLCAGLIFISANTERGKGLSNSAIQKKDTT